MDDAVVHRIDPSTQAHLGSLYLHSCQLKYVRLSQPITLYARLWAGRVQARPLPLTGAGLTQNLHQVAVDETVEKQASYYKQSKYVEPAT